MSLIMTAVISTIFLCSNQSMLDDTTLVAADEWWKYVSTATKRPLPPDFHPYFLIEGELKSRDRETELKVSFSQYHKKCLGKIPIWPLALNCHSHRLLKMERYSQFLIGKSCVSQRAELYGGRKSLHHHQKQICHRWKQQWNLKRMLVHHLT